MAGIRRHGQRYVYTDTTRCRTGGNRSGAAPLRAGRIVENSMLLIFHNLCYNKRLKEQLIIFLNNCLFQASPAPCGARTGSDFARGIDRTAIRRRSPRHSIEP